MIRLGLYLPNFSYGTGVEQVFPTVIAQAAAADTTGFDELPRKLDVVRTACEHGAGAR